MYFSKYRPHNIVELQFSTVRLLELFPKQGSLRGAESLAQLEGKLSGTMRGARTAPENAGSRNVTRLQTLISEDSRSFLPSNVMPFGEEAALQ